MLAIRHGYATKLATTTALSIIFAIQSYYNIDYISLKMNDAIIVGKNRAIVGAQSNMSDGVVVSREHESYYRLVEKGLFIGGIDNNTIIAIPDKYGAYYVAGHPPHGFYLDYENGGFARRDEDADDHLTEWNNRIVSLDKVQEYITEETSKIICMDFYWMGYTPKEKIEEKISVTRRIPIEEDGFEAMVYVSELR
ncbi:hypothetical protein [Butyrivibrio sp. MB2005]|uniref:hypothetical protein n=1 Tax=Butyrivibrio sp. MB2005 TaxID=1280678 RepID=UPI00047CDAC9|nr:hypothetical protein [Butyrivibrio sp. MB2005]